MMNLVNMGLMMSVVLTSADTILKPAKTFVTLLETGVAIWGIILVIKNVSELSAALKGQDDSGISAAVKGLIGGLLMASIGSVLTFLGIQV